MQVYLFSGFAKKRDSTARPDIEHPDKTVDVTLKPRAGVSYQNPSIEITSGTYPAYNYAYIPALSRYYFAQVSSQHNNNFYTINFELDPLATARAYIENYTCYIERTSDANYYNVDLPDQFLSAEDKIEHTSQAVTPIFISGNSYIARIVGKDTSGIATYVFASLDEIGRLFNPVFAQYFTSGDWSSLNIGDFVQAFLCDPSKYLVAAYYSPLDGSMYTGKGTSESVYVGFYPANVVGYRLTDPVLSGTIALNKPTSQYSDFRGSDAAFSQYIMYLPGVGSVNLSPDIMEGNLSLKYHVDLLTGAVFYKLFSSSTGLVGTYTGSIYAGLQTAKGDISGGASFLSSAAGAAASFAVGDVLGASAKTVEAVKGAIVPTPSVNGSQAGIAALRSDPDVIISVLQKSSGEFPVNQIGRPCCKNLRIGSLSGFVKCGAPSIALPMESAITDAVNDYLANGFYFE